MRGSAFEVLDRAAGIRQARGGAFSECARMHGALASFDRPPTGAAQTETRCVARALETPMHSMPADLLT